MSALALDLGSTRIKAARIDAEGRRLGFAQAEAPAIAQIGARREFDSLQLLQAVARVLAELQPCEGESLGITSQRSSFLLWTKSGLPVTPVISWQDRRGAEWIAAHADAQQLVGEVTGLPLSAHYVGPKLAAMLAADGELARRAHAGELRLGTLDTWIASSLSQGRLHATDETMAARTLLFDPRRGEWSPRLCELFGVPSALLPRVLPSSGRSDEVDGSLILSASIADQSAGALHAVGTGVSGALINFGTGTFVLAPNGPSWIRRQGYPTSLLVSSGQDPQTRVRSFALEGTVNAGASLLVRGDSTPEASDSLPADAWALVDENGIGAPHWRSELGPIWSPAATRLPPAARARVAELGLCFRVRELLLDLKTEDRRCVVAGGALHDAAFAQRLADALGRSIEVCLEPEATLAGIAALASGAEFTAGRAATRSVAPSRDCAGLESRFEHWRQWVASTLAR